MNRRKVSTSSGPQTPERPTLEQVAKMAGVSRATVSRVVNGVGTVDPGLRQVVERAIAATGYVPNRAARSLVTGKSGAIALVVSEPRRAEAGGPLVSHVYSDPFFGRIISGIIGVLGPRHVHPLLIHVDSAQSRRELLERVRQGYADGVALVSVWPDDPLPALLAEASVPTVLFARSGGPVPVSYVDVAHRHGAELAVDHLIAGGRRRIATVSGPVNVPAGADRLAGFREAMARHGQPDAPSEEGNFTLAGGEQATRRLLAARPGVDAIFAANDVMAQGAVLVLGDHGRRVPDDVAVVGFDDSSAALACRPPLTTVRQPVESMAGEMARLLLAHIDDRARPVSSVIFEPELIIRQSA
jgi:DNA-binding LacI/PurR family transcriptional regulator